MKKLFLLITIALCSFYLHAQDVPNQITNTVELNNTVQAAGDIEVQSGAELVVTGILKVSDNASIIVYPGGKLTINGGTITSMGANRMWKGVVIMGKNQYPQSASHQGYVYLYNGVIENAVTGVQVWDGTNSSTGGGVIHAYNSTFKNNKQAVEFGPYSEGLLGSETLLSKSYFTRCTFTIDNNHYLTANNHTFSRHVYLNNLAGIRFSGCAFKNETTAYPNGNSMRGRGIYANNAEFTLTYHCQLLIPAEKSLPVDPGIPGTIEEEMIYCPGGFRSSTFNGFYYGVYVSNPSRHQGFLITNTTFTNNYTGIFASNTKNAAITSSTFNTSFTGSVKGIYLSNCSGYEVRRNNFYGLSTSSASAQNCYGIYVYYSGTDNNILYRNYFSKMGYGIYVNGNNGLNNNFTDQGLMFQCNTFLESRYGIYITDNATVRLSQGSVSAGADNKFRDNLTDIRANTQNYIFYYYSQGNSQHAPVNIIGNLLTNNTAASANCNSAVYQPASETVTPAEARNRVAEAEQTSLSVDVYPNPVTDKVTIAFSESLEQPLQVQFFDMTGRCVHKEMISGQNASVTLNHLTAGIYFYQISDNGKIISRAKLIKE